MGRRRDDILTALVCKVIADVNRGKKQKPHKVEDFMPRWAPKRPQTPEQQLNIIKALNAAFGGDSGDDS